MNQEKKELLQHLAAHSPYYQNIFKKNQVDIGGSELGGLLNCRPRIRRLQTHNEAFLCVPGSSVIEYKHFRYTAFRKIKD
jgi:hypothetical protein